MKIRDTSKLLSQLKKSMLGKNLDKVIHVIGT
jgi:hypothetical protein